MLKTPLTGVDASTSFTVAFGAGHLHAHAVLSCNITLPPMEPCVVARFRNGNIIIPSGIFRPTTFVVQWFDKPGSGKVVREEKRSHEYVGFGWHFQADEVARCVRDGKLESELWGHDKSLVEMEIFDEVVSLVIITDDVLFTSRHDIGSPPRGLPTTGRRGESGMKWTDRENNVSVFCVCKIQMNDSTVLAIQIASRLEESYKNPMIA
jgi:hypothetical protein